MTAAMNQNAFETEHTQILNGLNNIKKKHNYNKVRMMLNDDGSGEIQAYDKTKSIGFKKKKSFQNYDELLSILQEYVFVK